MTTAILKPETYHNISFGTEATEFKEFFDEKNNYEQIHIHLQTLSSNKMGREFLTKYKVAVDTEGIDTGSTTKFPIGHHDFKEPNGMIPKRAAIAVKEGSEETQAQLTWDSKGMVLGKEGSIDSVMFKIIKKVPLHPPRTYTFGVPREDIKDDWTALEEQVNGYTLKFRIRTATNRVVSKDHFDRMHLSSEEKELDDDKLSGEDEATDNESFFIITENGDESTALLQYFDHDKLVDKPTRSAPKAILWIPGRCDGFMHPHVYDRLLKDSGYDLYVLNYRSTSKCLNKGWVSDPGHCSHNKEGDFDIYNRDIELAITEIRKRKSYDLLLGYAHSTGGPVLINYLMNNGDEAFDGFIFNSPFLDYGGGKNEIGPNFVSFMTGKWINPLKLWRMDRVVSDKGDQPIKLDPSYTTSNSSTSSVYTTPRPNGDRAYDMFSRYDVKINDWSAKIYSQYYFGTGVRPIYQCPPTAGFVTGVERVHAKIQQRLRKKKPITSKPFVILSSRADDVLNAEGMRTMIDAVGTSRTEIELGDNAHDVFLSLDDRDTNYAIDFIKVWMGRNDFL